MTYIIGFQGIGLVAGDNITLTPGPSNVTISATGGSTPQALIVTTGAAISVDVSTYAVLSVTDLNVDTTITVTGTATEGQSLRVMLRSTDSGHAVTWGAGFVIQGRVTVPGTDGSGFVEVQDWCYNAAAGGFVIANGGVA